MMVVKQLHEGAHCVVPIRSRVVPIRIRAGSRSGSMVKSESDANDSADSAALHAMERKHTMKGSGDAMDVANLYLSISLGYRTLAPGS